MTVELIEQVDTNTETKNKPGYYPKWLVIFHNDTHTSYQFVVAVLVKYFNKPVKDAQELTERIHHEGLGVAGVYPKEQAEFRAHETMKLAREHGFPLEISIEAE